MKKLMNKKDGVDMKVFSINHDGHYIGGHSIVVAETETKAKNSLKKELLKKGLEPDIYGVYEVDTTKRNVIMTSDGQY